MMGLGAAEAVFCVALAVLGQAAAPDSAAPRAAPTPNSASTLPINYESDSPPATAYDQNPPAEEPLHWTAPEDRSLMQQFGRTIVALGFVVALMYLLAKVVLPKFYTGLPRQGSPGQLKIVERIPLDGKHSLVLVEVGEGIRLLVGTGEGGVQLLTELPPSAPPFQASMNAARSDGGGSPGPGAKRSGDAKIN